MKTKEKRKKIQRMIDHFAVAVREQLSALISESTCKVAHREATVVREHLVSAMQQLRDDIDDKLTFLQKKL